MASVIGTGSAALLKAISNPLSGLKRQQETRPGTSTNPSGETLGTIIEGDFIPRLLFKFSARASYPPADDKPVIGADAAEQFASLPLTLEADQLLAEVESFLDRGVGVEAVFLDLLAPSARWLGQLWEADECDFVDVTMGLWRLQEVMREIAARSPPAVHAMGPGRTALFSPMPGDQHGFGSLIIDEIFARAGWDSEALIDPERRELLRLISEKSFDLVGLTISCDCPSGPVSQLISAIRSVSVNPRTQILIGGRAVNSNPDLVGEVGADGTAVDAEAALRLAARLVEDVKLSA
ncbi:cobalamin B12-binding protein [Erythrobacter sp.]|uniref:cobalamin B12-binding domain-containing protein n=1 Tax=Erythrobacter sp. TaxID=1042 RepID=UPI0025C5F6B4|nr:cobalamin B12-binding protein [Erythrobacter sp.]